MAERIHISEVFKKAIDIIEINRGKERFSWVGVLTASSFAGVCGVVLARAAAPIDVAAAIGISLIIAAVITEAYVGNAVINRFFGKK